ncbi:MAG: hypothetical protein LC114_15165 [Bryobacterales bacterium]|jgi:hypothetical protein|nr:hypothetical protein [Bryobacterales bacterium]
MKGLDLALIKKTEHSADVPSRHIRVMAAELERLQAECARLEAENITLRSERALRLADAERVCAWIDDPSRKSAVLSFTDEVERQIAYRFELLLRGEFICKRCGLRKDGEAPPADF